MIAATCAVRPLSAWMDAPRLRMWLLFLADLVGDSLAKLDALLQHSERVRASRFVPPGRRLLHVAAHGLKRLVLGAITNAEEPVALRFGTWLFGKPFLHGWASLDFSLSHCDGLVGIAVSIGRRVGLDIEAKTRVVEAGVAEQFFSAPENAWLRQRPSTEVMRDRLRLWTLKEAVAKACGLGLADGFDGFDVGLDPLGVDLRDSATADRAGWRRLQDVVHGAHMAALAVESFGRSERIRGEAHSGLGVISPETVGGFEIA